MSKIKDSVKKITPFVKPYKFGFLTAILLIVIAAVFSAIAPRTEGLVITQLTNDSFDLIKGVMPFSTRLIQKLHKVLITNARGTSPAGGEYAKFKILLVQIVI